MAVVTCVAGESSQEKEEEITPIHEIVEAPKVICNYCKKVGEFASRVTS